MGVQRLTPAHEGISFGHHNYPGFVNNDPRFRTATIAVDDIQGVDAEPDKGSMKPENKEHQTDTNPALAFPSNGQESNIDGQKTKRQNKKTPFSFPKDNSNQKIYRRKKREDVHAPYTVAPEPVETVQAVCGKYTD